MAAPTEVLVTAVLALLLAAESGFAGQLVEYFPGYNGKLPFNLETGYISVEDSEMFYYFIESQGNPAKDPLFLWLTGGPGCSSFFAIIFEIGPLEINIDNYGGGPVTFNDYADAWTKSASIIFLDSPVGTGFSYSTTQHGWATSDTKAANQAYTFLLKWLEENPKYLPLETYIAGDSYSGMIVPQITKLVVLGLEEQVEPRVNLKGYLLGSPTTDEFLNANSKFIFAHRMGLISDDIYETAKESCKGNYMVVEPNNTKCALALAQYNKCVNDLFTNCILEPKCTYTKPHQTLERRALQGSSRGFIFSPPRVEEMWCRNFNYVLTYNWANDPQVREAIHVRKDTVREWLRCNASIDYTKNVESVIDIHKYLTTKQLNVLVQSGDRDMIVPFVATMDWIQSLNLTVDEVWRPWFVDGQVAGYTEKYYTNQNGYRMVFAIVKGAGHVAPEYCRRKSFQMFDRWVHWYPM